jgi:hypothetical protein
MEGSRWGEFKYDAFNLRTFINATLCPHPAQQLKKNASIRKLVDTVIQVFFLLTDFQSSSVLERGLSKSAI